jgi:GntR family transcriptional repressor for pyruvate dehydrogenase complex
LSAPVERTEIPAGRRPLSDAVAERIEAMILTGEITAGEKLPPERELADRLGVNRSSVREALKKLEQLHLVEIQQGSGIRACPVEQASPEIVPRLLFAGGRPNLLWIRDLMELRELFFLGIVRFGLERATPAQIDEAVQLLEKSCDPTISDERYLETMFRLQDLLVRMTRNRVVSMLWASLRRMFAQSPELAPLRSASIARRKDQVPFLRRFVHSVRARDVETTLRLTREMIRKGERGTIGFLSAAETTQTDRPARA